MAAEDFDEAGAAGGAVATTPAPAPPAAAMLTGAQKVAIMLVYFGKDRAARVLQSMRETEVEKVMAEVAKLGGVDQDMVEGVIREFHDLVRAHGYYSEGGMTFAREVLEASLGEGKAHDLLERLEATLADAPFEFLRRTDPRQVLSFLQDEHPQTIALVLAHMHPEHAASVMSGLPDELQADVAYRLALMEQTPPDVVAQVERVLQDRLSSVITSGGEGSQAGGVQPLVDILNRSDRATERLILEGLERLDADLAEEVRSRMFVFEDIVTLDDRSVQLVLRQVDQKQLAIALKGVRDDVKEKILTNMSERASTLLVEEIEILGPVRLRSVEEAQGSIVRVIRALEEEGQIVVARGGTDEFVV